MKKIDWSRLNWRETWDYVDSAFLELNMDLEDLLKVTGLDKEEYFQMRRSSQAAGAEILEKIRKILEEGWKV